MSDPVRLFMIAGEPSGDLLGGALLEGLRTLRGSGLHVEGVGGPAMEAQGLTSRFAMHELSVMGLAEVLPRVPNLLRRIRETADAVVAMRPDALITIDSPDFCLRVARRARRALPDLRVIHYVAPSVWAWRPGRAAKMARVVDHVLALLPFEPSYMHAAGMTCDFVGHPVVETPRSTAQETEALRSALGLAEDQRILAVLPGSRAGEVARLGPVFAEVAAKLLADRPDLVAVIPAAAPVAEAVGQVFGALAPGRVHILDPRGEPAADADARKRAAFTTAEAALAASGTVSLELAAADTPMVIAYGANPVTAFLVKRMVRIDSATLVNLVTDTRAVPEFLFENCTAELIAPALARLLDDPASAAPQHSAAARAMEMLGRGGDPPGLRAARSVLAAIGDGNQAVKSATTG